MPYPRRSDESSGVIVNTRVTSEERDLIRRAAAANRLKPSEFMRDVILDAVSEALEPEPNGSETQTEP